MNVTLVVPIVVAVVAVSSQRLLGCVLGLAPSCAPTSTEPVVEG